MVMSLEAQAVPLTLNSDGVIRVGGARVRLDTLIYAFNEGYTAEEIVSQYPVLRLADVYAVIAYYLNHREAVDEYLRQRADMPPGYAQKLNKNRHISSSERVCWPGAADKTRTAVIRFVADEDFDNRILRGLLRRWP